MRDMYVGVVIRPKATPKTLEMIGHLDENYVSVIIGDERIRLTDTEFSELMDVANEILKRLDNHKMEHLL